MTDKKKDKKKVIKILEADTTVMADDDDWIRAARLKEKADAGDKEAQRELEAMQNTRMVSFDDI